MYIFKQKNYLCSVFHEHSRTIGIAVIDCFPKRGITSQILRKESEGRKIYLVLFLSIWGNMVFFFLLPLRLLRRRLRAELRHRQYDRLLPPTPWWRHNDDRWRHCRVHPSLLLISAASSSSLLSLSLFFFIQLLLASPYAEASQPICLWRSRSLLTGSVTRGIPHGQHELPHVTEWFHRYSSHSLPPNQENE